MSHYDLFMWGWLVLPGAPEERKGFSYTPVSSTIAQPYLESPLRVEKLNTANWLAACQQSNICERIKMLWQNYCLHLSAGNKPSRRTVSIFHCVRRQICLSDSFSLEAQEVSSDLALQCWLTGWNGWEGKCKCVSLFPGKSAWSPQTAYFTVTVLGLLVHMLTLWQSVFQ